MSDLQIDTCWLCWYETQEEATALVSANDLARSCGLAKDHQIDPGVCVRHRKQIEEARDAQS